METKKQKIVSAVATMGIVLMLFGATYAYFAAITDAGKITDVKITANTVDLLTFEIGNPITLSLDQESFAENTGDKTGSTFAKATLTPNNKTNTATDNYNVYLNISDNTFDYSLGSDKPEILLQVTDADGVIVTSLDGQTYSTVTNGAGESVSGFDITTKIGLITIADNKEITANTDTKEETWNIRVVFVNYNEDQSDNAGNSFKAKLEIQKEEIKTLANWVIAQYNGTQGNNFIYHHDSTLENGAGDNSYRYSGPDVAHPDYYTCTYNNLPVLNDENSNYNYSSKGDCDTVYEVSYGNIYVDGSFEVDYYNEPVSISWDSKNNVCLTIDGAEVFNFSRDKIFDPDFCTGVAYQYQDTTSYIAGIEKVGSGTETLYDSDNSLYTCKYNEIPVANSLWNYNSSSQGSCSTIYKIKFQSLYVDKTIEYNLNGAVSIKWDSENQICKTVNDDVVYEPDGIEIVDFNFCTGTAYYFVPDGTYRRGITKVGSGIETLYEAAEGVKNFVCFGSDEESCPDDNLYRIIGVFEGQVKLIKWDIADSDLLGEDGEFEKTDWSTNPYPNYKGSKTSLQAYYWNSKNFYKALSATGDGFVWSYSELNTVNLNTNYLKYIGTKWSNKIAETTWKVGKSSVSNIQLSSAAVYTNEITNPDTTIEGEYSAKVGLMYVSDYGFAAAPSAWTTNLVSYSGITKDNWMYMGVNEWTITRVIEDRLVVGTDYLAIINSDGEARIEDGLHEFLFVRPTFYLKSSITYESGSGAKSDPIRLG